MISTNYVLAHIGDIGSIVTAITAVFAYFSYRSGRRQRVRKLKSYFRGKEKAAGHPVAVSLAQIAAEAWMTPDQVLEAIFASSAFATNYSEGPGDFWTRTFVKRA
ncbi:MAG TPA: hypothetical protein VH000_11145 [Rhizomicrobium sp.]|jgi:hypothetical protein|nr:hypothetical protein [Rhizomicrobium sp.]